MTGQGGVGQGAPNGAGRPLKTAPATHCRGGGWAVGGRAGRGGGEVVVGKSQ